MYVILGDIHQIYNFDTNFQCNLKKASKLSYKALHPGNNKQNVSLALSIFGNTTITVSSCCFPGHPYMNVFFRNVSQFVDNCEFQVGISS